MTAHPHSDDPASRELLRRLLPHLAGLVDVVAEFLADEPTPATTFAWERDIAARLREVGRTILEYAYHLACPT